MSTTNLKRITDFNDMFIKSSTITIVPVQANASVTEDKEKNTVGNWAHIVGSYKSSYSSVDENGNILEEDNATIKTIKIKFSKDSLVGVNNQMFKEFFTKNIVGQYSLTLPVHAELPVYNNKVLVKNETQAVVLSSFKLLDFIADFNKNKQPK